MIRFPFSFTLAFSLFAHLCLLPLLRFCSAQTSRPQRQSNRSIFSLALLPFLMQKIVVKLDLHDNKDKQKALKAVSVLVGMWSYHSVASHH